MLVYTDICMETYPNIVQCMVFHPTLESPVQIQEALPYKKYGPLQKRTSSSECQLAHHWESILYVTTNYGKSINMIGLIGDLIGYLQ